MKTLFLIFALCACDINISAQNRRFDNIDYTPFIGEWIYESNDTVFKISLRPIHEKNKFLFYGRDCLYGGYSIEIKGYSEESYFNEYPDTVYDTEIDRYNVGIRAYQNGEMEELIPGLLNVHFYDKEQKHGYHGLGLAGSIYLLSSDEILWELKDEHEWAKQLELPCENKGCSVPTYAILKKAKNEKNDQQFIDKYKSSRKKKVAHMPKYGSVVELDSLVGIWKYESNDTVFRIKLKKELYNDAYWMLTGNYELHCYDSTKNPQNSIESDEIRIYARNYKVAQKNTLYIVFRDRIKKHNHGTGVNQGIISIISPDKIHWNLQKRGNRNGIDDFSVPTNVILTREE